MAKQFNSIEKRLSGGGKDTPRLEMTQFIKLSDAEKIESDVMNDLLEAIQEKFEEQRKPGESFDSWLKRTPKSELKRIELSNGGSVGEKYGDLIDAYEKKIDVMPGESLTEYINRIRKAEAQKEKK